MLKQYNTKPSLQEYVLIPRNNLIEIAQNSQENERYLHDVLNASWFSDYEEAKPMESNPEDFIKINLKNKGDHE